MDRNHQGVITLREMQESLEVVSVSPDLPYECTVHIIEILVDNQTFFYLPSFLPCLFVYQIEK